MDQIKIEAIRAVPKEKVIYDGNNGIMIVPRTEEEIIESAKIIEGYLRGDGVKVKLCGTSGVVCEKDSCCKNV